MSKKITLQKLSLTNFKGIKKKEILFNPETSIFGDNGTGKTTLFDAFTWVLFGKDSEGKTDFGIKTNDSKGNTIEKLEHIVEAELIVDSELIVIQRTLKENWVKKRGSLEAEFSGNKTEYLWNDVPKSQREFQDAVSNLLDEHLFKLITNPLSFNSLKWQDARDILIDIAGEVSNEDLAKGNTEFEALLKRLSNKSLKDLKDETTFKRKRLNEEIKAIPTRVDEVFRNMPEEKDYKSLEIEKESLLKAIDNVESQIQDKSKAYQKELDHKNQLQKDVFEQEQIKSKIEFKLKSEIDNEFSYDNSGIEKLNSTISEKISSLQSNKNGLESLEKKLKSLKIQSDNLKTQMDNKREAWETENARTLKFDDKSFACPSCKRELEQEDIEQEKAKMLSDFNEDQRNTLLSIQREGKSLAEQKESIDKEIIDTESRIKKGNELITDAEIELVELGKDLDKAELLKAKPIDKEAELEKRLLINEDHTKATIEINRLKALISKEIVIDNEELKAELSTHKTALGVIEKELATKEQREIAQKRINDLNKEESKLAQQISDIEKEQFTIENFEKAKASLIESRVNDKFKVVKFKLFETQINGAEVPCCITLINGVPFSDANTASKINAGVDIINILSNHYGVNAPIFIDNRESVIKLIESKSQIINLIVSEKDKDLRVA